MADNAVQSRLFGGVYESDFGDLRGLRLRIPYNYDSTLVEMHRQVHCSPLPFPGAALLLIEFHQASLHRDAELQCFFERDDDVQHARSRGEAVEPRACLRIGAPPKAEGA